MAFECYKLFENGELLLDNTNGLYRLWAALIYRSTPAEVQAGGPASLDLLGFAESQETGWGLA